MPVPPPTETATKSLKGAKNAVIAHGRVQGYAKQRLRPKPSKCIVECAQGDQSLQGSIVNHQLSSLCSVPGDAIAAYDNTPAKRLHQYQ